MNAPAFRTPGVEEDGAEHDLAAFSALKFFLKPNDCQGSEVSGFAPVSVVAARAVEHGAEFIACMRGENLAFAILPLFVPCHLNGFELLLIGVFSVVGKTVELHDPSVKIGEPYRERVCFGMAIRQCNSDIFGACPG